jgi:hypothetical protein
MELAAGLKTRCARGAEGVSLNFLNGKIYCINSTIGPYQQPIQIVPKDWSFFNRKSPALFRKSFPNQPMWYKVPAP